MLAQKLDWEEQHTRSDDVGGVSPSSGAVTASLSDDETSSSMPPCSPAPESASAVRAGGRRSPLHHELNRLAAVAKSARVRLTHTSADPAFSSRKATSGWVPSCEGWRKRWIAGARLATPPIWQPRCVSRSEERKRTTEPETSLMTSNL